MNERNFPKGRTSDQGCVFDRGLRQSAQAAGDAGGIVVERTAIGYLCIGFGEAARTLRFVFDDDETTSRAFADPTRLASTLDQLNIVRVPVAGSAWQDDGDRHLRRLASISSLAKLGGYNPDEPRDNRGRWTFANGVTADASSGTSQSRDIGREDSNGSVRLAQELLLGPPLSFLFSKPPVGI
jgi:hypothetical protein